VAAVGALTQGAAAQGAWERLPGLDEARPGFLAYTAIALHPTNPARMLVAGRPFGVQSTSDGGRTWARTNGGLDSVLGRTDVGSNPTSLRFDPRDPGQLYLGLEVFGVFKSTDEGRTWQPYRDGLPPNQRLRSYRRNSISFAFPPDEAGSVFVTSDGGLDRSVDGGRHWAAVTTGLPDPTDGPYGSATLTAVAIDPVEPRRLFAIYYTNPGPTHPGGVYRSEDGGRSWRTANAGLDTTRDATSPEQVRRNNGFSIAVDPVQHRVVLAGTFAGIFRSTDHAGTWRLVATPRSPPRVIRHDPERPGLVYAGGHGVVLVSRDAGQTWEDWAEGLAPREAGRLVRVMDLAVAIDGTVYVATDAGLFRRRGAGGE